MGAVVGNVIDKGMNHDTITRRKVALDRERLGSRTAKSRPADTDVDSDSASATDGH